MDTHGPTIEAADPGTWAASRTGRYARRVAEWSVLSGLAAIALVYSDAFYRVYPVPKTAAFRVAVGVALAAGCVHLLRRWLDRGRSPDGPRLRVPDILVGAFVAWMGIAALASAWPLASLLGREPTPEGWLGFVGYAVFYVVVSRARGGFVKRLLGVVASVSGIVGALAILEMRGIYRPEWRGMFGARAVSTLGNPVAVGALAVVAIPVTIALCCAARDRRVAMAWGLLVPVQMGGLYYSFGRGAWLGTAAAGVLFGVLLLAVSRGEERARVLTRGAILLAATVVCIGVFWATQPRAVDAQMTRVDLSTNFEAGTSATRLLMWQTGIGLVGQRPVLGWGEDTFLSTFAHVRPLKLLVLEDYTRYFDRPHNQWLYLAYSGGIPALALYLAYLGVLGIAAVRALVRPASAERKVLLAGLLAAVVGHEVEAFFGSSLPALAAVAFAAQGALVALAAPSFVRFRLPRGADVWARFELPHRLVGAWRLAVAGALLALAVPILVLAGRDVVADRLFTRGIRGPGTDLSLIGRAVALEPDNPIYARRLGQAYELHAKGRPWMLDRAQRAYESGLRGRPWDPQLEVALGALYQHRGSYRMATQTYRDILVRDPHNAAALYRLAWLMTHLGQPRAALPYLRRLTRFASDNAEVWSLMALASDLAGNEEIAAAASSKAAEIVETRTRPAPRGPASTGRSRAGA